MKNSFLKKLQIFYPLTRNFTITLRGGIAKGLKRKGGFGFIPRSNTLEENFLLRLPLKGKIIFDIGGFVGICTLFFARAVTGRGKVFTFEPNPQNYKEIITNLKINNIKNVKVLNIGVSSRKGKKRLLYNPRESARGTYDEKIKKNMKKNFKNVKEISISVDTIDNLINKGQIERPDFVKIDVEGAEMDVLEGMIETVSKYKPELFIEIHGANLEQKKSIARNLLNYMTQNNYSIYHVELGEMLCSSDFSIIKSGHIYCSRYSSI